QDLEYVDKVTIRPFMFDGWERLCALEQGQPARRKLYKPVLIDLPRDAYAFLKENLSFADERLHYILLSEADTRTLRAVFPKPETFRNMLYVGFFHNDEPGGLAAILRPLAAAGFNILTSLIRRDKVGRRSNISRNVFEAQLEFQGAGSAL